MTVSVFAIASGTNANLVVNGSFEDAYVCKNQWKWFTADQVHGWDGSTIEIWNNFRHFSSFDGQQHAELNAHNNGNNQFSIYQSFATTKGASYDVSFAYAARTSNNEQFSYTLESGADIVETSTIRNHLVKKWSMFETSFVASSDISSIMFTSIIPSVGTVGNFLDDVVVALSPNQPSIDVSATTGIGLIFAAMLSIIYLRKR